MKAVLLTLAMGILSLGAAASQPSDLSQYFNHKYKVLAKGSLTEGIPNKGVKTAHGTVYTKLFNICQEDGMIKTINPVRVCSEWGYKVVRCDDGSRTCYDRDERVCKTWVKANGASPINYTRKVCARKTDPEAREWRRRHSNDDRFNTDYPNCTVFKNISMKLRTNYDFLIIKTFGYASSSDERRYGGALVDELDYTIPACSAL